MIDFTGNRNDAMEFTQNKRTIEPVDYKTVRKYGIQKGDVVDSIEIIDSEVNLFYFYLSAHSRCH